MLEMFPLRDREPVPQLVPWAGEFVGKYLISAVQALRMSDDAHLRRQVADVVREFISTQAEDGYLGPFPKKERLLKNWDLWWHYHAIYALLLWHEQTGDPAALAAARRAADLVCATFLDTGRRVFDAGDPEMNMTILTALAMLHRRTGEARYLRMAREVETDWERAGDYLQAGLDGREYLSIAQPPVGKPTRSARPHGTLADYRRPQTVRSEATHTTMATSSWPPASPILFSARGHFRMSRFNALPRLKATCAK